MVDAQMIVQLISLLLFSIEIFIGLYLLKRAKVTGLTNILWLCFYFFFIVFEGISKIFFTIGRPAIGDVNFISIFYFCINLTGNIFLVVFIKFTFYLDRKSPFFVILSSTIIAKIAYFVVSIMTEIEQSLLLIVLKACTYSFIIFISSFWLSYASFSSYNKIKKQNIAPWVKKRYLMVGISAIFLICQIIPILFIPYRGSLSDPFVATLVTIVVSLNISFAILGLFAWVMPKWLKRYLNQGYKSPEDTTLSEDALMEDLKSQLAKGGNGGGN
jgi:hypothetical protein